MGLQYFYRIWSYNHIKSVNFGLSFILSSLHFLKLCTNFTFILVTLGNIMILLLISWLCVHSSEWDTVASADATTYPISNTLVRGIFLCRVLLKGRRILSHCSEPIVSILIGVGHRHKFIIIPPFSSYLYIITPYLIPIPRSIPPPIPLNSNSR